MAVFKRRAAVDERRLAVAELQRVNRDYGLRLTDKETGKIIDTALKERTKADVKKSVRDQLFRILCRRNPRKAIGIEIDYYSRKGKNISTKTRNEVAYITDRKFLNELEAQKAYAKASGILRKSFAPSLRRGTSTRIAVAEKEKRGKLTELNEKQIAARALRVLQMGYELAIQSREVRGIYRKKIDEFMKKNGIDDISLIPREKSKRIIREAAAYAENSSDYKKAFKKLEGTFKKRNDILESMEFTNSDTVYFSLATWEKKFKIEGALKRVNLRSRGELVKNIRMLNAFMIPLIFDGIERNLLPKDVGGELSKALSEDPVARKQLTERMREYGFVIKNPTLMSYLIKEPVRSYVIEKYLKYSKRKKS